MPAELSIALHQQPAVVVRLAKILHQAPDAGDLTGGLERSGQLCVKI